MFYRRRITPEDAAPVLKYALEFLRNRYKVVSELDSAYGESFLIEAPSSGVARDYTFFGTLLNLERAGYVARSPWGETPDVYPYVLSVSDLAPIIQPTITPTHFKLPDMQYLLNLTPDDFFTLMRILATSKVTMSHDSITLNMAAAGVNDLSSLFVSRFLTKLKTNYRINTTFIGPYWTPIPDVQQICALPPTLENQMSSIQYLNAVHHDRVYFIPVNASVNLELDWPQGSEDYCTPPDAPASSKELYWNLYRV